MGLFGNNQRTRTAQGASRRRARLQVEQLEARWVPYSVTGNAWPHPEMVTLSFVPDGTIVGGDVHGPIYSNLFAKFNSHPGWTTATWQDPIIAAAQAWAQQTNLNLQVVADNGADAGSGDYQQGDPGYGDIRIGGYVSSGSWLASAYLPPPVNNYSAAGDINFNLRYGFNISSAYDLFSVTAHEMGHAFGMGHTTTAAAVMYPTYGLKTGLNADDISGIRNIYSDNNPRSVDHYNTGTPNNSFTTATDLTSQIDPVAGTTLQTGLDITTTSTGEFYTFTAPQSTTGTLQVNVQTAGLSLLRQAVTVYAADKTTVLASGSNAGAYDGTTVSLTVNNVSANQQFYVKVAGADTTSFGTGAYAMTLNFGSGANPTVPLPNTETPNGDPLSGGGGINLLPGQAGRVPNLPLAALTGAADLLLAADAPIQEKPTGPCMCAACVGSALRSAALQRFASVLGGQTSGGASTSLTAFTEAALVNELAIEAALAPEFGAPLMDAMLLEALSSSLVNLPR